MCVEETQNRLFSVSIAILQGLMSYIVTTQVPRPNRRDSALCLSARHLPQADRTGCNALPVGGQAQGTVPTGMRGRCQDLSSYLTESFRSCIFFQIRGDQFQEPFLVLVLMQEQVTSG